MSIVNQMLMASCGGEWAIERALDLKAASAQRLYRDVTTAATDQDRFGVSLWVRTPSDSAFKMIISGGDGGAIETSLSLGGYINASGAAAPTNAPTFAQSYGAHARAGCCTTTTVITPATYHHILLACDLTLSPPAAQRLYIDGTEVMDPSWAGGAGVPYGSYLMRSGARSVIGADSLGTWAHLSARIAEVIYVDGAQPVPAWFVRGTGAVCKPINPTGLPYGNNGFRLEFRAAGDLGRDTSGRGNHWTPVNITSSDQTASTPSHP